MNEPSTKANFLKQQPEAANWLADNVNGSAFSISCVYAMNQLATDGASVDMIKGAKKLLENLKEFASQDKPMASGYPIRNLPTEPPKP